MSFQQIWMKVEENVYKYYYKFVLFIQEFFFFFVNVESMFLGCKNLIYIKSLDLYIISER